MFCLGGGMFNSATPLEGVFPLLLREQVRTLCSVVPPVHMRI